MNVHKKDEQERTTMHSHQEVTLNLDRQSDLGIHFQSSDSGLCMVESVDQENLRGYNRSIIHKGTQKSISDHSASVQPSKHYHYRLHTKKLDNQH